MYRILAAIALTFIVASEATAGIITVDYDALVYNVGDTITITATVTPVAGDFNVGGLTAYNLEPSWAAGIATVANIPAGIGFGTSSQNGALVGTVTWNGGVLGGLGPPFINSCGNTGNSCIVIDQTPGTAGAGPMNTGVSVTGTLVLTAAAPGALLPQISSYINQVGFGPETNVATGISNGNLVLGANWLAGPVVVPEPSTLLLLGAGLSGLAFVGRRNRG